MRFNLLLTRDKRGCLLRKPLQKGLVDVEIRDGTASAWSADTTLRVAHLHNITVIMGKDTLILEGLEEVGDGMLRKQGWGLKTGEKP